MIINDAGITDILDLGSDRALCEQLGFTLTARHARRVWPLSLWQRRRMERGEPIVATEDVLVFRGAP